MVSTSSRVWALPVALCLVMFIVCFLQHDEVSHLKEEANELNVEVNLLRSKQNKSVKRQLFNGFTREKENLIYCHVHIAKTGGTALNGILANKYERVCGNKGENGNY